jgi:Putative adhesin
VRTFTSSGTARVHLELRAGGVEVRASEDGAVHGEIDAGSDEDEALVEVQTLGDELRVSAGRRGGGSAEQDVHVRLQVPAGLDLTLVAGSADLHSDVRLGRVFARSGSGDLRIAGTAGARLQTGSGDITVLSIADEAELSSGSGDIRVNACASNLAVRTASGDVSIGRLDGHAEARLASGDFRLAATTGSVSVRTTSGDIVIGVAAGLPAWLDLNSVSGDVSIALPPAGEPEPDQSYVSLHARTASGDIRIDRA